MALVTQGFYSGKTDPGKNMIDLFKQTEVKKYPNTFLRNIDLTIYKIAIEAPPDTELYINNTLIKMPNTGQYELGYGMIDITNIKFLSEVDAKIYYFY